MGGCLRGLIFLLLITFSTAALANDRDTNCIKGEVARKISINFRGISLNSTEALEEYCEDDLGSNQFKVFKVIERIKQATKLNIPRRSEDALSLSHIDEHNWWHYFETRIRKIEMPRQGLIDFSCGTNIMAYVTRPQRGTVFLCPHFFSNFTVNDLVSTLIHEARHFDDDGHRHALCNDGVHKGKPACDEDIHDRGSYAVGLQVLVRLAQDPENSTFEKYELEARALYKAHTNFNIKPNVKITESLILADNEGSVFHGTPDNLSYRGNIGQHKALAYTRTTLGNSFTVIPENNYDESIRLLPDFSTEISYKLNMQKAYETEGIHQHFLDIDFLSGTPAILTKYEVISNCRSGDIQSIDVSDLSPVSLINYNTEEGSVNKSVVLKDGNLLDVSCNNKTLELEYSSYRLHESITNFGIKDLVSQNDVLYGLLGNGKIVEIAVQGNIIHAINNSTLDGIWKSLTKVERPSIFEK